jgi:uncharacterized protein YndB with AHSA1/START domain
MSVVTVDKDFDNLRLTVLAEFHAPIERVWELWADPRQLERWWGPPTHPATVETHELVVGSVVTYFMTGPRGEISRGRWRVTSVDPPTSLEFIDGYANEDGTPNREMPSTTVEMRLHQLQEGSTRMVLRFAFESINDMHGHKTGDAVLEAIASTLVRSFPRRSDVITRVGGDEFAVILRDSTAIDGERLASASPRRSPSNQPTAGSPAPTSPCTRPRPKGAIRLPSPARSRRSAPSWPADADATIRWCRPIG